MEIGIDQLEAKDRLQFSNYQPTMQFNALSKFAFSSWFEIGISPLASESSQKFSDDVLEYTPSYDRSLRPRYYQQVLMFSNYALNSQIALNIHSLIKLICNLHDLATCWDKGCKKWVYRLLYLISGILLGGKPLQNLT